jgi:prepilin-type N-terminal cleavage/methylation domain-containing protein
MMNTEYRKSIKKHRGGFTAIEIIAVIFIMAIVGVIAVSRVTSTKTYNVAAEVETLKANLRYAQFRALSDTDKRLSSNATTWGITVSANSYTLQKTETTITTPVTTYPSLSSEGSSTHNLAAGISLTTSLGTPVTITYDGWGIPSASGIPITSNVTITITDGASPQTITVTKNTGFIP